MLHEVFKDAFDGVSASDIFGHMGATIEVLQSAFLNYDSCPYIAYVAINDSILFAEAPNSRNGGYNMGGTIGELVCVTPDTIIYGYGTLNHINLSEVLWFFIVKGKMTAVEENANRTVRNGRLAAFVDEAVLAEAPVFVTAITDDGNVEG